MKNDKIDKKNNKDKKETEENSFEWLVIDSATTLSLACNEKHVGNIIKDHTVDNMEGHDEILENRKSAEFKGMMQMPCNEKAKQMF